MNDKTNPPYYDGDACMRKIAEVTRYLCGAEAFCIGQAMKYIWRAGRKDGESGPDDLDKGSWYLIWAHQKNELGRVALDLKRRLEQIIGYTAPELYREKIMEMTTPTMAADEDDDEHLYSPFVGEQGYLDLLSDVLAHGERRANRTGIDTMSVYGVQLRFDLRDRFPLFTTKKVWWKGIAVELDWMLQGTGDVAYMQKHGVKIWDAWAKADYRPEIGHPEGQLGPVYGVQWRHWPLWRTPAELEKGYGYAYQHDQARLVGHVDQLAQIVRQLRRRATGEVHSDDRRILLNSWNVGEIDRMKLPPCHYGAQFLVDEDLGLTTIVSIRSWDLFLGGPFNVAQYALLTHLLAAITGLKPRRLVMNAGDAHIYSNHVAQVSEQIGRKPTNGPHLIIDHEVKEIDDFRFHHARVVNYEPQGALPGEVAV